jgi:hypothetical protein
MVVDDISGGEEEEVRISRAKAQRREGVCAWGEAPFNLTVPFSQRLNDSRAFGSKLLLRAFA